MSEITYSREGKLDVRPGDPVTVAGTSRERGWRATLIRFEEAVDGTLVAVVTRRTVRGDVRPGVRHVRPERLTRRLS